MNWMDEFFWVGGMVFGNGMIQQQQQKQSGNPCNFKPVVRESLFNGRKEHVGSFKPRYVTQ